MYLGYESSELWNFNFIYVSQEKQMDVYYELKVLHVLMKPKVFALLQ